MPKQKKKKYKYELNINKCFINVFFIDNLITMIMKKSLLSVFTMVAMAAAFSACSNDDKEVTDENGDVKSVFMKMELPAVTRAAEPSAAGTTATATDLHLYFHDGTNIMKCVTITSTSTPSIAQITSGAQITDVPAAATHITIYGNKPSSVSLPSAGTLVSLKSTEIEILTQGSIAGVLLKSDDVMLSTYSTGTPAPAWAGGIQDGDKYAEVDIIPAVARIEVEGLQVKMPTKVAAFTLKGIYLNNFYERFRLDGDVSTFSLTNYGANSNNYVQGQGLYTVSNNGKLYDEPSTAASGSPLEVTAGGTNRWAYQVVPNAATVANDQLQIIFKLDGLSTIPGAGITFPVGAQFLTVRGFLDKTTNAPVKIEAGKIYTIEKGDFTFDESNLTTVPVVTAVGVWLKVTVKPWTVVAVKPNL